MSFDSNQKELLEKYFLEVLGGYFFEPGWPRLSPRSFLVWAALVFKSVPVVGISSVSRERIRSMTGIGSNVTVSRSLFELLSKGYIRELLVDGAQSHPAVYHLVHHRLPGSEGRISHGEVSERVCSAIEGAE